MSTSDELAQEVLRSSELYKVAQDISKLLTKLAIANLGVVVSGTQAGGVAHLTGVAPSTMEREYARVILEGGGWSVKNDLTAKAPADPSAIEWLITQAEKSQAAGKPDDALRLLEAATIALPTHARAWGMHGRLLNTLGRKDEALESLRRWKSLSAKP